MILYYIFINTYPFQYRRHVSVEAVMDGLRQYYDVSMLCGVSVDTLPRLSLLSKHLAKSDTLVHAMVMVGTFKVYNSLLFLFTSLR